MLCLTKYVETVTHREMLYRNYHIQPERAVIQT